MFKRGGRLLPSTQRVLLILPIWLATSLWMWLWWLNSQNAGYKLLYIPLTLAILYEYAFLPTTFLYFVLKAKIPTRRVAPMGVKVAVITLCVPSQESSDIVEKQLKAMSEIRYPHDSWILDEGNSIEVKKLARKYGVKHFSRKGIRKYNLPLPPYKAKTKAGNVNAWLDRVARRKYEYFVQLDIDHIPKPDYLHKTLGYFRDEKVAWVQAPSIYKNTEHWTARGAAELELVFQGPLQMGFFGHCETPFIIGSHCTYRMKAIQEIGGFQPTRAEDHLDTVAMASKGWKGVYLPEIIAEGDGPETLNTYFAQHFAWAYSMFQVLLYHTPKLLPSMPLGKKLQFLFAQTWYPLWSFGYMVMFFVPLIALVSNHTVVDSKGISFIVHFIPMFCATFLIWWAARPLMQPKNLRLSWRGILLHAARWPIIVKAILSATFRIKKPYMITPKGKFAQLKPSTKLYMPFLILGFISCIAIGYAFHTYGYKDTAAQMFFAFMNVFFALLICTVDLDLRLRQTKVSLSEIRLYWLKPVAAVMTLFVVAAALVFSTVSKDGITYAIAAPHAASENINLSAMPASKLTDKQILQQLQATAGANSSQTPPIGIFDPTRRIRTDNGYIRHSFIDWRDNRQLAEQLLITQRLGATPLITLEPRGQDNGQVLLSDIANGAYDAQLNNTFSIMSSTKSPVYARFAHEMDLSDLYPWGSQDPAAYIAAYRHVVLLARAGKDNNIKWVWSPAGNPSAAAYYPGDDVVDIVGTTILYDRYWYSDYHPSFNELAAMRTWLINYNKPVWVVEFGVGSADPDFQNVLIQDALAQFKSDGFSALVYLNIVDSNISGPDYELNNLSVFGDSLKPSTRAVNLTANIAQINSKPKPKIVQKTEKLQLTISMTNSSSKPYLPSSNKFHPTVPYLAKNAKTNNSISEKKAKLNSQNLQKKVLKVRELKSYNLTLN